MRGSPCRTSHWTVVACALALGVCAASCGNASPARPTGPLPESAPVVPVIVALGDSLMAGPGLAPSEKVPALLQERVRREGYPHRVVNAGVSGDTSADALRRFNDAIVPDTRVLIVALGANDGLRGVPVATLRGNLAEMLTRARSRGLTTLLCGMETPPIRGWDYTLSFHNVFPDLAREYDVALMPFLLVGVFGDPDLNMPDLVHPNAAGARVIAENMWPYLKPLLGAPAATSR